MRDERVILVTGSSSGIGAEIAKLAASRGMRVVINSSRSVAEGRDLAASLPDAHYVRADVSDADEARRLVDETVAHHGRLDVLVNNAGTTRRIPHQDIDAVDGKVWREILDVNLLGTWNVIQAALSPLRTVNGSIVNISSIAGSRPAGSSIPYAVSKAAVEHLTRLLAKAVGPEVRVNAVAPGLIDTKWTADFADIREEVRAHTPLRRIGTSEEIADAVLWLAGAPYSTGEVLGADGGAHLL
ncbi:polyketide synthase [Amycolatopsis sp. WAC 04197]|uniref:SDR family NAD(P)-dependent oxidoreductase n=1 Tax=Amycolatopsis sp. WAC 04197 TaxID=2203199 RepID=UPI000F785909|nr:SDR family oxidoreductase [Amycolatopsis sp. WAC 04197]RSN39096.1 polyketide synthase [Amycolatopsis sp. WAC 04197]